MKTGRILLLLGVIIIGILIFLNKIRNNKQELTNQNKGLQQPMLVNGLVITTQTIEDKIYASGTLLANEEVEIRNEVPGRVTALLFKEGKKVISYS